MDFRIDHVAFGWSDRERIAAHVTRLDLEPVFGGTHRDGTTEMSLIGFDDGSYLEFIAPTGDQRPARWPKHLLKDGGPAAWAIRVEDVAEFAKRMIDRGVRVNGPVHDHRERPDGTRVEWDHCLLGSGSARTVFPFAIADRTPRSYRTSPTNSVANSPLRGISEVVVGVDDLASAVGRFRRIFQLPVPDREAHGGFGAKLAHFPGQPLTLAEPTGHTWLRPHMDTFGRGPVGIMLVTDDMGDARKEFPLEPEDRWFGRRFATFESEVLGYRLGVLER